MSDEKKRGIGATNREFVRYDQVDKSHTYQLAETGRPDEFDDEFRIETCDMRGLLEGDAKEADRFAQELGTALQEIGFAIVEGHGIDPALHEEAERQVVDLFTRTPLEHKMRFRARRFGSVSQGYFPLKETSDIHPDLVEGWVWCRRAFDLGEARAEPYRVEEFWPRPEYERFFRRVVREHEKLILPLTRSMFRYLGVDPHVYDAKLTGTNFGLRLNYYPKVTATDDSSGAGRLLGHEDVDLFTILPAPRVEGLQVWNRRNEKWVRLTAPPGSIVINTGDYMQRITNDVLPSTSHRVGKPRDGSHLESPRVSLPMAVYLWESEVLEVLPGLPDPKYEPIEAITFHTRTTSKFYGDGYAVEGTDGRTERA